MVTKYHFLGLRTQSCSVSKETIDLTVTRGTLWSNNLFKSVNIIILCRTKVYLCYLLWQLFPYWQNSFVEAWVEEKIRRMIMDSRSSLTFNQTVHWAKNALYFVIKLIKFLCTKYAGLLGLKIFHCFSKWYYSGLHNSPLFADFST